MKRKLVYGNLYRWRSLGYILFYFPSIDDAFGKYDYG